MSLSIQVSHHVLVRWQNMACLAAAWLLVALCLIKGVKTSGKVFQIILHIIHIITSDIDNHYRLFTSPPYSLTACYLYWLSVGGLPSFSYVHPSPRRNV